MGLIGKNQKTNYKKINSYAPVSVIIPCYNCEDTISRAVNSVAEQTWKPKELILINDGSQDNTLEILKNLQVKFGKDWVKIINLPENKGPSYARDAGWAIATQPYIAFLDADDSWHPKKIEIQCNYMITHPEVALTGHRWIWVKDNLNIPKSLPTKWNIKFISKWRALLISRYFATPTVMIGKEVPYRFPIFTKYSEDRFLYLQIVLHGYKAVYLNIPLAYIYKAPYGEKGLTQNLWAMEKGELEGLDKLYHLKLLNKKELTFCKIFSFIKYIRRKFLIFLRKAL